MADPPTPCPICTSPSQISKGNDFALFVVCPNCGRYNFHDLLLANVQLLSEDGKTELSHWIRAAYDTDPSHSVRLWKDTIQAHKNVGRVSPNEQANRLITWLGNQLRDYSDSKPLEPTPLRAIMGAKTAKTVLAIAEELRDTGTLKLFQGNPPGASLTFEGWHRYEALKSGQISSKRAFMAMAFGEDALDNIYRDCFQPAVAQAGFELVRADDYPEAGLIDNKIRVEIRKSRFVVADLTTNSLGAYFEAGFAEGLGRPVFYTCEKSDLEEKRVHFDTRNHLIVPWTRDTLANAAADLTNAIRNTLPSEAQLDRTTV